MNKHEDIDKMVDLSTANYLRKKLNKIFIFFAIIFGLGLIALLLKNDSLLVGAVGVYGMVYGFLGIIYVKAPSDNEEKIAVLACAVLAILVFFAARNELKGVLKEVAYAAVVVISIALAIVMVVAIRWNGSLYFILNKYNMTIIDLKKIPEE